MKLVLRGTQLGSHVELNRKSPLTEEHFNRWQELFYETLDEHFSGEKVELAKARTVNLKQLMLFKNCTRLIM